MKKKFKELCFDRIMKSNFIYKKNCMYVLIYVFIIIVLKLIF